MSFGEVDTLTLLFDKLQNLLNDTQGYYESFLDTNGLYKQGKLSEKEFFQKLGDYVVAYSALEFLSIKVIFELKKALDKIAGGHALGGQSGGTMPSGMSSGGQQASHVTAATLPGAGGPPSVISAATAFSTPGVLPPPDPSLLPKKTSVGPTCSSCGSQVKATSKFCTKCGSKI